MHQSIPSRLARESLGLGSKQELLSRLLPLLIAKAHSMGYEVRLREIQRGPQQAKWNATHCARCRRRKNAWVHRTAIDSHRFRPLGIKFSVHLDSLAIDFYLRDPRTNAIQWSSVAYAPLGEYWKSLHPLCRWGGDFKNRDGGHFSLEHNGRK
jgi:hypothetical protein